MSQDFSFLFRPCPSPPRWVSQIVAVLLCSPFHSLMSRQTMLLTLQGRKTGTPYTLPVTYLQEGSIVFCLTRSNWWKNLRNGAVVQLHLRGRVVAGFADTLFDPSLIAQKIAQIVQRNGREAKYFSIRLNNHNRPDPASLQISAQHFILICIHLLPPGEKRH